MKSYKKFILIVALFCGVNGLAGCSATPSSNSDNSATRGASPQKETTGEKIGVPECDDYLEKYEACLPKLPENEHEEIRASLKLHRMIWKEDAKTAEGKAKLVETCKGWREQSKQMRGDVCGW